MDWHNARGTLWVIVAMLVISGCCMQDSEEHDGVEFYPDPGGPQFDLLSMEMRDRVCGKSDSGTICAFRCETGGREDLE